MMNKIAIILMMNILFYSLSVANEKSEAANSFEAELFNSNGNGKFKHSGLWKKSFLKYRQYKLMYESTINNKSCLIYHAEDPKQNKKVWKTKTKNIAVGLIKKNGHWVVEKSNFVPGTNVEAYNDWMKIHGCINK